MRLTSQGDGVAAHPPRERAVLPALDAKEAPGV
jgi:hypothetical protein